MWKAILLVMSLGKYRIMAPEVQTAINTELLKDCSLKQGFTQVSLSGICNFFDSRRAVFI